MSKTSRPHRSTQNGQAPPAPLLDQNQAADFLRLSPRTLEAKRLSGNGPKFVRISARAIRYRIEDLQRFVEERVVHSTSEPVIDDPK
jgi:hypothetical protein